jgi:hypothetical protein
VTPFTKAMIVLAVMVLFLVAAIVLLRETFTRSLLGPPAPPVNSNVDEDLLVRWQQRQIVTGAIEKYRTLDLPGLTKDFPHVQDEENARLNLLALRPTPNGPDDAVACYEVHIDVFSSTSNAVFIYPGIARLEKGDCPWEYCRIGHNFATAAQWAERSCPGPYRMGYTR